MKLGFKTATAILLTSSSLTFWPSPSALSQVEQTMPDPIPDRPSLKNSNKLMMQYFHWYLPSDGTLWKKLEEDAKVLADTGFTALWLPPAYKGIGGGRDVGYGVYDHYDLGEFFQKGSVRTKYGTKAEYLDAIAEAQSQGIEIYADIVINHKLGADRTEIAPAIRTAANNRVYEFGKPIQAEVYTVFDFPGRGETYSDFKWRWFHFDGTDYTVNFRENGVIYRFLGDGKYWDQGVSTENGNYDYLMGSDLDLDHPEVIQELSNWGKWYVELASLDGFRLDAVKHIKKGFFNEWLAELRQDSGKDLFAVGEYWSYHLPTLLDYLKDHNDDTNRMSLFDAPLHLNFHIASREQGQYDMKSILSDTLVQAAPDRAVTLVDNHDTQPIQALESPVEDWFKPLAYAIILLREDGYPTVFHADYYGAQYRDRGRDGNEYDIVIRSHKPILDRLIAARRDFAYGLQRSYFDHHDVIGWTRSGNDDFPEGLAVLLSDQGDGTKWMEVGKEHADRCFIEVTGQFSDCVKINASGWGEFKTKGRNFAVWVGQGQS